MKPIVVGAERVIAGTRQQGRVLRLLDLSVSAAVKRTAHCDALTVK